MVEFGVLGPLQVVVEGQARPISSGKHRALLAALLLARGRPVLREEIIDAVWGENPPANPRSAVNVYVTRLRTVIGEAVQTTTGGYRIAVDQGRFDLTRFESLVERAGNAGHLHAEAAALDQALGLWRGQPLADVPSDTLQQQAVPGLREQWLRVVEWRTDVNLRIGRCVESVGELAVLTAQHPLRERLWVQLMTALQGSGRRADALAAYEQVRRHLADELGIDPGEELQRLHAAILTGTTTGATGADLPPVARQLPPDVRGFTGRYAELAHLDLVLDAVLAGANPHTPTGTVVISAIAGTAGVGKTALAVHFGHLVRDLYPDGQLWVNLRGYDPGQAMTPEQALTTLLRALGVPPAQIPGTLDDQVGMYRSLMDGRRMLVVLDNAHRPEQVRPLLPGAPGCLVVVTSRDDLAGHQRPDGPPRRGVRPVRTESDHSLGDRRPGW